MSTMETFVIRESIRMIEVATRMATQVVKGDLDQDKADRLVRACKCIESCFDNNDLLPPGDGDLVRVDEDGNPA